MICRDGVTLAAGTSHGTDLTLVEKPRGSPSLVSPGALMANHGTCRDPTVWYSKTRWKAPIGALGAIRLGLLANL